MLSKFARLSLVSTALAPILLTLWFIDLSKDWIWSRGLFFLAAAIALTIICLVLLSLSKSKLEKMPVEINSVKTADREIGGFILVYLLPLINESTLKINCTILIFVMCIFFIIVLKSNAYHFNPLLGFFGYHFYEITVVGEVSYILISKKTVRNCKNIRKVVHISEYMILEA